VACLILGIMPHNVVRILDSIASPIVNTNIISGLTPEHSVATVFSGFGSISTAWMLLVMLIMAIIIIILLPMRSRCKYETWGCGQPVLTARNEYTATAFTQPIKKLFGSIYRESRNIQTMYSGSRFFKGSIKFESHIESIFERYLYVPIIDFVKSVSRTAKVIQAGSIHAYIAYVFATLIILLMYVLSEEGI